MCQLHGFCSQKVSQIGATVSINKNYCGFKRHLLGWFDLSSAADQAQACNGNIKGEL
jgi:hypothetical protein